MKNLQKQIDSKLQMTCLQISKMTGVRHDSVKRTIETLSNGGIIEYPQTVVIKTRTKPRTDYVFIGDQGERDSVIVIAQVLQEMNTTLIKVGLDYHARKEKLSDYFIRSINTLLVREVLEMQS